MMRDHYPKMAAADGRRRAAGRRRRAARPRLRVLRAAGRKARRDRRRRVVSAHRHAAHVLPLAAIAATCAISRSGCSRPSKDFDFVDLPRKRRVLRLRRHLRGQERRRVHRDGGRQGRVLLETGAAVCTAGDNSCLMQIGATAQPPGSRRALRAPRRDPRIHGRTRGLMIRVGDAATAPDVPGCRPAGARATSSCAGTSAMRPT